MFYSFANGVHIFSIYYFFRVLSVSRLAQRYSKCLKVLGVLKSSHPRVDEGKVLEHALVHAVDQGAVCAGQTRLFVYKLFIKVAAVTWRFLRETKTQTKTRISGYKLRHTVLDLHVQGLT